jgi:hypothetical protein
MNLATIRAMVRRRANEITPDQWSDVYVNSMIDIGYKVAQAVVLESEPTAFLQVDRADLVAGQHEYAWPVARLWEIEVALLNPTSAEYVPIDNGDFVNVRQRASGNDYQYAHYGRWLYLGPAPAAPVVAGLQVTYVPTLTLATDASVPQIKQLYHMVIVLNSTIALVGETADGIDELIKERDTLYGRMRLVRPHAVKPNALRVDIRKGY